MPFDLTAGSAHNDHRYHRPEQLSRYHRLPADLLAPGATPHPQATHTRHAQFLSTTYEHHSQYRPEYRESTAAAASLNIASRAINMQGDQGQLFVEQRLNAGSVGDLSVGATGLVRVAPDDIQPRQQPRAKPESKEKQRKLARQSMSEPIQVEQRGNRCLHCILDRGKRGCFNYPLCDRCNSSHEQCTTTEDPNTAYFIDWHYWLTLCQQLNEASNAESDEFPMIRNILAQEGLSSEDIPDPIMLEFNFRDRSLNALATTNIVLMCPDEQAMKPAEDSPTHGLWQRAPALDQPALNNMIRTTVWGQTLWNSDGAKLTPDETKLWDLVRLFTGYFAMLHNLGLTFVQSSDLSAASMLGRVQAELIYALGFHLQGLYHEIFNFPIQELIENDSKTSAAAFLYSFEVLYRLVLSMRRTDWQLTDDRLLSPLRLLQEYLNQRVEHILCQFRFLECRTSGHLNENRQMKPLPAMVRFARAPELRSFPRQCIITASRYSRVLPPSVPCSWGTGTKHRGMDLLLNPTTDVFAILSSENIDELLTPTHIITDDNTIISFTPLVPLLDDSESDGGSSVISLDESHQANSNVTELAARLLALDQGAQLTGYESGTASPGDLPSLANSSPISIDSPVTPTALTDTAEYLN